MEADLRAARLAQELHAIVLATFQDQSAPLFRAATLQPPMSLVETPGGVELPPNEAHQRGRRVFEQMRGELLQRTGAPWPTGRRSGGSGRWSVRVRDAP